MPSGVDWLEPADDDHPAVASQHPVRAVGLVRRIPRRVGVASLAMVVAGAVVAALLVGPGGSGGPTAAVSSAPTSAREVGTVSEEQVTIARVVALAAQAGPPVDYIRQTSTVGSCPPVRVGSSPASAIAGAVRTTLPDFTLATTARTLDQFGLCSIELRSRAVRGAVLVLSVAAPSGTTRLAFDRVRTGVETVGTTTTRYVLAELHTGWTVLVGARGDDATLPSSRDLMTVARTPTLSW